MGNVEAALEPLVRVGRQPFGVQDHVQRRCFGEGRRGRWGEGVGARTPDGRWLVQAQRQRRRVCVFVAGYFCQAVAGHVYVSSVQGRGGTIQRVSVVLHDECLRLRLRFLDAVQSYRDIQRE